MRIPSDEREQPVLHGGVVRDGLLLAELTRAADQVGVLHGGGVRVGLLLADLTRAA